MIYKLAIIMAYYNNLQNLQIISQNFFKLFCFLSLLKFVLEFNDIVIFLPNNLGRILSITISSL